MRQPFVCRCVDIFPLSCFPALRAALAVMVAADVAAAVFAVVAATAVAAALVAVAAVVVGDVVAVVVVAAVADGGGGRVRAAGSVVRWDGQVVVSGDGGERRRSVR